MFQNIFSSLIYGVLLVSKDQRVLKVNPAAEEMFQRSREFFEGHSLSDLFPDQSEIQLKLQRALETGSSFYDIEYQAVTKYDQKLFPVSLTLSPCLNPEGNILGAVILVKDMSLLKELEEFSRPIDNLSTVASLALGMAHEIRNPLGGIRASAQLLRGELDNPEHRQYLEVVISEVDRINRIVERMMHLTRPPELNISPVNIHQVLDEIITIEREPLARKKIHLEQVYDPSLPRIEADKDQLKQVFINLIKNAVEASAERTRIQLITRVSSGYAIRVPKGTQARQGIVVEVIDSGVGMDEKSLKNLFTPFYTTKAKGSGLGLALSLKIVEDHYGKIKITSEKGLGTTVQVFLPVQRR